MVVSLVAMTWATPETLVANHESLNDALVRLDDQQWHQVFTSSRLSLGLAHLRREDIMASFDANALSDGLSARTVVALASRAIPETAHQLHQRFFADQVDNDPPSLSLFKVKRLTSRDLAPKTGSRICGGFSGAMNPEHSSPQADPPPKRIGHHALGNREGDCRRTSKVPQLPGEPCG